MASPSFDKNRFDFSKEKNHEKYSSNAVVSSGSTQLRRIGESSERNMLPFRRLLCFLLRLQEVS
jgi:hypothetical protein